MQWRTWIAPLLLLVAPLPMSGCGQPPPAGSLLLITLDTTRADHLGAWGYELARTPNLDRLAAEAVVYERAYSAVPETLPAHTTMLTGLYPPSHGVRLNLNFKVPREVTTLAEVLASRGFDTAAVVAAGVLDPQFALDQGFATYQSPADDERLRELTAEQVTQRALETAERFSGDRYFLWVHYYDAHSPFEPKAPFEATPGAVPESVELYDLELAYVDLWVGHLLDGLAQRDLLRNTVVIVVGDHGESLKEHGEAYHTLFVYDATQHVPLIVRAPGSPGGRRVEESVSTVDVFATSLELLGIEVPAGLSSSFLPGLRTEGAPRAGRERPIFSESMAPPLRFGWAGLQSVRLDRWLYIRAPIEELYDSEVDPGQRVNLAQTHTDELEGMRRVLARTLESMPQFDAGTEAVSEVTPEAIAKLEGLGYMASSSPEAVLDRPLEGEDPKDMVEVAEAYQLARLAWRLRRLDTAEELLRFVVAADPVNKVGWTDYGRVLIAQGRSGEAVSALQQALSLTRSGDNLVLMAVAQRERGEFEAARSLLDEALRVSPFPAGVWREIGRLRLAERNLDGAIEAYRKVLEYRPGDLRAGAMLERLEGADPDSVMNRVDESPVLDDES